MESQREVLARGLKEALQYSWKKFPVSEALKMCHTCGPVCHRGGGLTLLVFAARLPNICPSLLNIAALARNSLLAQTSLQDPETDRSSLKLGP